MPDYRNSKTKILMNWLKVISLGSVIILVTYFLIDSYFQRIESSKQIEFQKLESTVNALSLSINGDDHENLMASFKKKDEILSNAQSTLYQKINKQLKQFKNINNIETDIYTLIKYDGDTTNFEYATCFGVSSSDNPYFRHPYQPPKQLLEVFDTGGKSGPYKDDHGLWLSAIAPIYNSSSEVVAIIQADTRKHFLIKV